MKQKKQRKKQQNNPREAWDEWSNYRDLLVAVLERVIQDYKSGSESERLELRDWVENKRGLFGICAIAVRLKPRNLQERILGYFTQVDGF